MFALNSVVKAFFWTLIITCVVSPVFVGGKIHLHKLKESRLLAVRGQILTKLGLTSPPTLGKTTVIPTKEDLEAFNAVNDEVTQQSDQEQGCGGQHDRHGYFAKSVVSLRLAKRTGKTIQYRGRCTNVFRNLSSQFVC